MRTGSISRCRTGVTVERLSKRGERFVVSRRQRAVRGRPRRGRFGRAPSPRVPAFAAELDPEIVQLHSSEYRSPAQLREGGVLVVGAGNSGAEIAFALADTRPTWLAGRQVNEIPVRHGSPAARLVLPRHPLPRPPRADGEDTDRTQGRPEGRCGGDAADQREVEATLPPPASNACRESWVCGTGCRCSRMSNPSRSRT